MTESEPALRRSLSPTLLTLYGLGNILGAGIYVLIGKVAATAGAFTPWSFLLASLIAGLTAFSYAELSARYPLSAGEAVYLYEGFGLKHLASAAGLLIIVAGIVSSAAIARGFVGYFQQFLQLPAALIILSLVAALAALAIWGILESVRVAALFTIAEIFGLLLVVWVAFPQPAELADAMSAMLAPREFGHWNGILLGGVLAFFAYIGFEDMVNVAEEVRDPVHSMPRAILAALAISTLLYMLVALVAVSAVPPDLLAGTDAPLALIYARATAAPPVLISIIALAAVVNGALIQIIMASRVAYGLARQGWIPSILGRVNPRTRTPAIATLAVSGLVLAMALLLPVEMLARITSLLLLAVFALVNLALLRIRRRPDPAYAGFTVPAWVPLGGSLSAAAFLGYQLYAGVMQ